MKPVVQRFRVLLILVLGLSLGVLERGDLDGYTIVQAQTTQFSSMFLLNPVACPETGCAAGQRLNVRANYLLGIYDPAQSPNVQVCVYTPQAWSVPEVIFSPSGLISDLSYTVGDLSGCEAAPLGYELRNGASVTLSAGQFGDGLDFAFRIGSAATSSGTLRLRVLERGSSGWVRTQELFLFLRIVPKASPAYVANDATACGQFSPCYVNSGDDQVGGIGTSLKDAVDAVDAGGQILLLGDYGIKSQTVIIDKPLTLRGLNNASLTYVGPNCSRPMLQIGGGVTLRNLTLKDGSCVSPNRDLVIVNPTGGEVRIEYVTLLDGKDALRILDGAGQVTIRFSHIRGNSGYAIFREAGASSGRIVAVGNNLYDNRAGAQVECNDHGVVNHNFFGWSSTLASAVSQCEVDPIKVLGAPVLRRADQPGVSATQVAVTENKGYAFGNRIAFQHGSGEADFDLYIVEHGAGSTLNVPFTGGSGEDLIPCSSYWDVFLAEDAAPNGTLSLFFRYDLTPGCVTEIESAFYCGSGNQVLYPLWWYHPAANITQGWDTTGQRPAGLAAGGSNGQTTTCLTNEKEIRVDIDNDGRPSLSRDLKYLPFVVGLPARPVTPTPSITWTFTPSPTLTPSVTFTRTVTRTITPILTWTRSPTRPLLPTRTRTPTPTRTLFATRTPSRTPFGGVTFTPSLAFTPTPAPLPLPNQTSTVVGYPRPSLDQTLTPAGYPVPSPDATASSSPPAQGEGYPGKEALTPSLGVSVGSPTSAPLKTSKVTSVPLPPVPSDNGPLWAAWIGGLIVVGGAMWGYWRYRQYLRATSVSSPAPASPMGREAQPSEEDNSSPHST
ncbi:right-handed parallel beta-helix repeat-containing protein [uncultured Thermanaerothrix sp.]|uniref:right-handed parallel beta-helix repeat-containing protein n=1 Tax=uncultured Thermanaerothrix sp. TaxID=1195149 RepID=UPI002618046B|nr:right-handed parallel beta-helix repeat-containing protein [uncultured Thermanaerothrix sp.]